MDTTLALIVATAFLLAGTVKGVTGMGLPTVAVSLLGMWLAPAEAAALLVLPALATNLSQCRGRHWRYLAARLWPLWVALAASALLVPDLGQISSAVGAHQLLGAVLVAYGFWGLRCPSLPHLERPPRWLCATVGAITGLVVAATSIFVLPMVPLLQAMRLDKDALVQALGLSFMVATLALAVRVQGSGERLVSMPSLLALVTAFIGLQLGAWVRGHIGVETFQRMLFLVFIGLGASNLLRES
jgi:uncharacterized protein